MKMKKNLSVLLILSCLILTSPSCKKKEDDSTSITTASIITSGTWRITLYNDSGNDELSQYAGYTFTFTNGNVSAVKNSNTVTGTYSTRTDDSKKKLVLDFGAIVPFDELNDDWHIVEETSTKIRCQDVSGGNGGTDLVTFEKN